MITFMIALVFLSWLVMFAAGYFTGWSDRLDRKERKAALQAIIDRTARDHPDPEPSYGRFPVDTAPLFILSEDAAAKADLARSTRRAIDETDWLIGQGERRIPGRWR